MCTCLNGAHEQMGMSLGSGEAYQYAIPMTHPKSSSTKAATYSTIALGAGKSCINSLMHSITIIVIKPTTRMASSKPPGPASSRTSPFVVNIPPPITELTTMNYKKTSAGFWARRVASVH